MSEERSNPFTKSIGDHVARANAALDAYAKLEAQWLEQYRTAIDESARLSKEAIAYAAKVPSASVGAIEVRPIIGS